MKRFRVHRIPRRVLVSAALLLAIALPIGWVRGQSWHTEHVGRVTGRPDVQGVSCLYCHRRVDLPPRRGETDGPRYLSPAGLAVNPDSGALYVTAEGGDRLLVIDPVRGVVDQSVEIAGGPHDVAVSADGRRIAVSVRNRDQVLILDAESLEVLASVPAGPEPLGAALSADGSRLFVVNAGSRDLLLSSIDTRADELRLVAGNEPYEVALSSDGELLAVANRRSRLRPEPLLPAAEVTLVDTRKGRVIDRRELSSAHLSEGIVLSSDASFALVPVVRVRNYLPTTQVARGALMTSAIALVETHAGGRAIQFPLDEVNAYYADPSGIALSPDDRLAFIAHGGADTVSVVDVDALRRIADEEDPEALLEIADDLGAFARYVVARIPTAANPRALALSPDGRLLYVAERLNDSIAVIDTERLELIRRIDLGGPRELTPERRGERVFHDAAVTFQGQFSCRSCHPDGHTDGLNWDFEIDGVGQHRLDTRSLRGVRDTAPFKWSGKNPDLTTQCGPRFARVLTRSDPFTAQQLEDLVSFIESIPLPHRPSPEATAEARERGRRVFERTRNSSGAEIPVVQRCQTCHRPPLYTDRLSVDVGTGGTFDTPHLLDVAASAPYLHDGRALTLEEIWTVHSPDDTHGATHDLTKLELNDLVIFMRSL